MTIAARLADGWHPSGYEREHLRYLDERYTLTGDPEVVAWVRSALAPFVEPDRAEGSRVEVRAIVAAENELVAAALADGERRVVDASLYDSNSDGMRLDFADGWVVAIERTRALFGFSPSNRVIAVVHPDPTVLRHEVLRLLKALITTGCEQRGCLVVHASGVVAGTGATLFAGDSRNGKTTILLEALTAFDSSMLSCDTCVLCPRDGGVAARGWPSNFSVSIGTMHDYACLHPLLAPAQRDLAYADAWDIYPKQVLDTGDVVREAGVTITPECTVRALVGIRFAPAETTGIELAQGIEAIRAILGAEGVCLGSRDPLYPNWHGWEEVSPAKVDANLTAVSAALVSSGAEARRMTWAPSPSALLRRVQTLEPTCNTKPRCSAVTAA